MGTPPPLPGVSVLLLEDGSGSSSELESVLSDLGATVARVTDSAEAIQRLDALPKPNVIVCDLDWPGVDDWELWARLQSELGRGHTPVIAVTHESMRLQQVSDAGFEAILVKPVQGPAIRDAIVRSWPGTDGSQARRTLNPEGGHTLPPHVPFGRPPRIATVTNDAFGSEHLS